MEAKKMTLTLETTKLSSKGQVVIPEKIREALHLKEGSQFVVMGQKDVILLKTIQPLPTDEFDSLIREARQQAKASNLKKSDLERMIQEIRDERRKKK
jgi:AbrB family looped-hinge helix DNA binding protein